VNVKPGRVSLAGSRVVVGPDPTLALPAPPPDAASRVAALWNSVEVALPHDGTPLDALRCGLHMLARLDIDMRSDTSILLPALYVALVADDVELADAGERAEAWAWGLPDESPLIPVVDVLLAATRQELPVDDAIAHLLALPTVTDQIPLADRRFSADPGTALAHLALELGHRQVSTIDRPIQPVELERATANMLEAAGIAPAWIYASQHTDGLLPRPDGGFNTDADRRDWDDAIGRYLRAHPDRS
jgi:hypothetical protein